MGWYSRIIGALINRNLEPQPPPRLPTIPVSDDELVLEPCQTALASPSTDADEDLEYLNRLLAELGALYNIPAEGLYVHIKWVAAPDGRHYRLCIPDLKEDDQYIWSRFSSIQNIIKCSRLWDAKKLVTEDMA